MEGPKETDMDQFMCLKCNIVKFTNKLDVSKTSTANFSAEGLLALSRFDGSTSVFRVKHGNLVHLSAKLDTCRRLFWDKWSSTAEHCGSFYTQDEESGTVLEMTVVNDTVTVQGQLLLEPLKKALEHYSKRQVGSIKLAGYEKGYLLFVVNADTLCAAEISDNMCQPCAWVPLPSPAPYHRDRDGEQGDGEEELSQCFQVAADVVCVMHSQEQLLVLYKLCNGELVCQIDLQPAAFPSIQTFQHRDDSIDKSTPTPSPNAHILWSISPALDRLVWVDPVKGNIVSLSLQSYILAKPAAVTLSESESGQSQRQGGVRGRGVGISQSMRTCRGGGGSGRGSSSWRHRLVDAHRQHAASLSADAAWIPSKLTSTVSEVKKIKARKVAASGFRRKTGKRTRGDDGSLLEGVVGVEKVAGYLEQVEVVNYLQSLGLPAGSLLQSGYRVADLCCSGTGGGGGGGVVSLVLVSSEEGGSGGGIGGVHRAVAMVMISSGQVYFHSVPDDHIPVLTPAISLPIMLLSPEGLVLLAPPADMNKEDIISKLMVHSGAQTTDSLCQLNNWVRTTVPLQALEQSLRQRQLETVAFFLSSKQHLFSGQAGQMSTTPHSTHLASVNDILPALDLFLKVVSGDLADLSPPWELRQGLGSLALQFLYELVKKGSIRHRQLTGAHKLQEERNDMESALEVVIGYISQLRIALRAEQRQHKSSLRSVTPRPPSSLSQERQSADSVSVDTVDLGETELLVCTEEAVEKACMDNDLPSLQTRLQEEGGEEGVGVGRPSQRGGWGEVVKVGLQRAWHHVNRHDLTAAQSIISHLGLNVGGTLWRMVQFSLHRQLQTFVLQELQTASSLPPNDMPLVDFVHRLYTAYPNHNITHCHKHDRVTRTFQSPLADQVRSVQTQVTFQAKDIPVTFTHKSPSTIPPTSEGPYCVTALHWLRCMDEEMREALLLDGAVLKKDTVAESSFNPQQLWRYWLRRNNPLKAIEALEAAMSRERGMLGRLLEDYLRDLSLTSTFHQHQIKTHLLRKRVYRWEILQSLNASPEEQVRLLSGLLHTPHPLHGYGHKVLEEFHAHFITYCAQHDLVGALWTYCTLHGIDTEALVVLPCSKEVRWFKPFLCLHSAINHPDKVGVMCGGSLSQASLHWTPDDWTLASLLREGHTTAAIATLAYLPHTCNVTQGESQYTVDVQLLRSGLQRFPKLLSALLPPDADTSRFDINVYQLLRDNCPMHSTRLFGWQSTNNAASEDGMKVLPYFSQTDLVTQFGHTAKLTFTYYLRHGRPTYAFLSFLTEELPHKTSTLSPKRVAAACGVALWLSIKHFHQGAVSSACVAFVEMLGRDSATLRTYIHAGETILAHRTRHLSGVPSERRKELMKNSEREVVSLLQACLNNRRRNGRALLAAVEDAIADEVAKEGLSPTSVEAGLKWSLALLLCHHLHMPLSTRFLETCAHDDKWLPFLCFSQLHQYPKAQLQQVIHHFSSRHLRDHLHYIITNAGPATVTSAAVGSNIGQQQQQQQHIRSSLYSRIGVHSSDNAAEQDMSSGDEEDEVEKEQKERSESHRSSSRQSSEDDMDVTEDSTASDVFRVIFSALATPDPCRSLLMHALVLRNPLFAELAACCGALIVPSMCAWLVAMMSPSEHARFLEHDGKRAWRWSEKQLERLMEIYLECHAENTLTAAFFIFQPTSPLLPFLQFIRDCVFWRNYEECKKHLDTFKDAMASMNSSKPEKRSRDGAGENGGEGAEGEVVRGREWVEAVAYRLVHYELTHCSTVHDAHHLLALLAEENIALVFSFDVLDFGHLHKMLGVLQRRQVRDVHLPHLLTVQAPGDSNQPYLQECSKALEALMARGYWEDACTFGQLAGLDLSTVVLRQLSSEKSELQRSGVWTSAVVRRRYWKQSAALWAKFSLPAHTVAQFFQKEAEERESLREKSAVYKLSLAHLEKQHGPSQGAHSTTHRATGTGTDRATGTNRATGTDRATERGQEDSVWVLRDKLFVAMWRYNIQHRVAHSHSRKNDDNNEEDAEDIFSDAEEEESDGRMKAGRRELLHTAVLPKPHVQPQDELTSEEAMELEALMGDLLAEGHVAQCCDLATLLGAQSLDLTIVLTCIGLSTGEITVDTMDASSRLLLTSPRRRSSLTSLSSLVHSASSMSLASAAPSWAFLPPGQEEIIYTMEQLLGRCRKSRPCCLRIISVYKIACLVGWRYSDVVMCEEFAVLREVLKTDFPHRYQLAADFLSTSTLSDDQVAAFLVDEIVKSLRIYLGGKDGFDEGNNGSGRGVSGGELIFRPTEGGEVFSALVGLCSDPSLLGARLLTALASLADQSLQPSQEVLSMETELLIMAHECHTAACNMEGISNVLRAARVCAQGLASAGQYHLMMRLLTGIGRYSEMTYIFDFLQQHHQFEMLLRKGIDKEDKLKTAILDYLKRFHSDDKDTYSMVALNFSMYREIAHMLDESGHRHLALLRDKPMDGSKETQDTLKKCIQYFGDAAESYAKDKCLTNAQRCLRWARLVNLQLHLGSGVRVINLTPEEVKAFMASHPRFLEAFVVTEAYGRAVDWSDSLLTHVVLGGDMRYLQDFRTYVKLTPALIENTLYKLRQTPGKVGGCVGVVKKLLKLCGDVWTQHQVATALGMTDYLKDMLRNDTTASYINDLMAAGQ